ncbi:MAG: acetylglutamate kinase, partial [Acidimicrobiaceae bacterium]
MTNSQRTAIDQSVVDSAQVANLLIEALPYIQKFAGKTVVVKYGGNALAGSTNDDALAAFAKDIALLHAVGFKPVVVHGGGPQISAMMERLGKKPSFHNGLRVTDAETMEIVSMVLLGTVNPQLVTAINQHGAPAVGVSGQDANMCIVSAHDEALGFVGEITKVDATIVKKMLAESQVPVVA